MPKFRPAPRAAPPKRDSLDDLASPPLSPAGGDAPSPALPRLGGAAPAASWPPPIAAPARAAAAEPKAMPAAALRMFGGGGGGGGGGMAGVGGAVIDKMRMKAAQARQEAAEKKADSLQLEMQDLQDKIQEVREDLVRSEARERELRARVNGLLHQMMDEGRIQTTPLQLADVANVDPPNIKKLKDELDAAQTEAKKYRRLYHGIFAPNGMIARKARPAVDAVWTGILALRKQASVLPEQVSAVVRSALLRDLPALLASARQSGADEERATRRARKEAAGAGSTPDLPPEEEPEPAPYPTVETATQTDPPPPLRSSSHCSTTRSSIGGIADREAEWRRASAVAEAEWRRASATSAVAAPAAADKILEQAAEIEALQEALQDLITVPSAAPPITGGTEGLNLGGLRTALAEAGDQVREQAKIMADVSVVVKAKMRAKAAEARQGVVEAEAGKLREEVDRLRAELTRAAAAAGRAPAAAAAAPARTPALPDGCRVVPTVGELLDGFEQRLRSAPASGEGEQLHLALMQLRRIEKEVSAQREERQQRAPPARAADAMGRSARGCGLPNLPGTDLPPSVKDYIRRSRAPHEVATGELALGSSRLVTLLSRRGQAQRARGPPRGLMGSSMLKRPSM